MFKQIATTVPTNPRTVAGDINGDGRADFLQTSSDGTTISVLLGNGDGTTTPGATLTPAGGVSLTALGDVNGDGKLDLAIANVAGTGVTVALGNGNGTFQAQSHAFATGVTALALGDVNGDGRADLVTASGGDAIAVRLERGDGTFGDAIASVPYAHNGGTATYTLAVGDVTGDGRADIYVYDHGLGGSFILGGSGDGHFQVVPPFASFPPYLFSTSYTAPTIGDVNGDGRLDVLLTPVSRGGRYGMITTDILLGTDTGGLLTAAVPNLPMSSGNGGDAVNAATLADVNGDGRLDIVYSPYSDPTLVVLLNQPGSNAPPAGAISVDSYAGLTFTVSDPDGVTGTSTLVQRSNGAGGFDTIQTGASYRPTAAENGHDIRFLSQVADGNFILATAVSREVHVAGTFETRGAPVAFATTDRDDLLVGTYSTDGLSNIAVYADTVLRDTTITELPSDYYFGNTAEGHFSVTGPGGTDTLFHVQKLLFLDGEVTVNPNDAPAIVTRLYEGAFGRAPDSTGLSHFTASIEHGTTVRDVASALTASPEFQSHAGTLGNPAFVSALYQNVLNRTAGADEVQYWSSQLDAGVGRADVIVSIAQSGEAVSISQNALHASPLFALDEHAAQVARLYDTAFGRDPDRAGLEAWRGFLDQGGPGHGLGDVANAFAGSPEFTARYGQAGTDAYVTALYQNTLHRAPDEAGRAHWDAVLDSGTETRAQVALDFSESPEHQSPSGAPYPERHPPDLERRAAAFSAREPAPTSLENALAVGGGRPRAAGLCHVEAGGDVFVELVAQRPDRDAEDARGVGAVAQAMVQGVEDEVALDLGHGAPHEAAGGRLGHLRGAGRRAGALRQGIALGRHDRVGADLGAGGEQHRPVEGVFQLAHVAAPGVGLHQRLRLAAERPHGHAVHLRVLAGEVAGEFEDVGRALAQGRQAQVDDVEAVEQILAEGALLDLLGEVAVRGGQHPDVDLHRAGAADPVDHPLLERAQQLGLEPDVHLGDFVEQQRAAVGLLEAADAAGDRAGEGAFLVAEEFGFEQGVGDGGAVHGDERPVGAGGLGVDVAGQHLLAGAALARDEDRGVRARDLIGELDHPLHGGVAPHEGAAVGGHRLDHRGDQLRVGREWDVFLGAGLDGGHRRLGVRGDAAGHDGRADALGRQRRDEFTDGEADIDHDEVGALGAQHGEALLDAVRLGHGGAAAHGDLRGGDELAVEPSDHQEPHGLHSVVSGACRSSAKARPSVPKGLVLPRAYALSGRP